MTWLGKVLGPGCLAAVLLLPAPGEAASFTASRPAAVNKGLAFDFTGGMTSPTGTETFWFHDIASDCPLCNSSSLPIAELGVTLGDDRIHLGLFGSFPSPQIEVYGQLHEGEKVDIGVGARAGIPLGGQSAHQVFLRSDYQLSRNLKLVVDPGLYYQTARSPNGWSEGSALFFTPSLGLAFATSRATFTPSVALVTGGGDLKVSTDVGERHFHDTFAAVSIAVTFHRRVD